jgi:uncharacterized membrane protein
MLSSKRKAHLIIITVFILGVTVGASAQYLLTSQAPPRSASTINDVTNELTGLLKLTDAQRVQVTQILGECQQQSQDLKNKTRPQFQAIRDHTRGRILAILSNEQQPLYTQWTRNLDAKRERKAAEDVKQKNNQ